jgi:hypothetical protein
MGDRRLPRVRGALARAFIVAVATSAIAWVMLAFPQLRAGAAVSEIAAHLIAGEAYKPDVLDALDAELARRATALRPASLSKVAVVRLRRAEEAIGSGDRDMIDVRLDALARSIDDALTNAPEDPFLWLVLFWLDNTRNGFAPEHLAELRMSYALGPNEGWIAAKRNSRALAIFSVLPPDLAEAATAEFVGLARSPIYFVAVDNIAGPGWPVRHVLLPRLKELQEADRRAFAKLLNDRNVDDAPVPDVEPLPRRPWQH